MALFHGGYKCININTDNYKNVQMYLECHEAGKVLPFITDNYNIAEEWYLMLDPGLNGFWMDFLTT